MPELRRGVLASCCMAVLLEAETGFKFFTTLPTDLATF